MEISAKIIAHSVANNIPLITMELCYPRFIHAEAKTHRVISLDDDQYELVLKQNVDLMDDPMLSRNASSSRAIPIEKMIEQVKNSPAMPIHWGKNQPGMQAGEECTKEVFSDLCSEYVEREDAWKYCSLDAIGNAENFMRAGYHKQVVNRLVEPFQWIKVIVTATEWDNFFKLRDHPDAQPEIQELARCMKKAMDNSTPVELKPGEWHLPYVEFPGPRGYELTLEKAIKCSVARCARVSYNNHDNSTPDIEKDIALADRLLEAGHCSPFEHQATPMPYCRDTLSSVPQIDAWVKGITHIDRYRNLWSSNFRGWLQYRQLI